MLCPQRTRTLLKEYKERDKSNVFVDKRLGEYNSSLSAEEKMMRRFALEQQVRGPWGSPVGTCPPGPRPRLAWPEGKDPYGSRRARRGCVLEFSLKRWLPLGWVGSEWPAGHAWRAGPAGRARPVD